MKKHIIVLLMLITLLIFGIGCAQKIQQTLSDDCSKIEPNTNIQIKYTRSGSMFEADYTLRIDDSGIIIEETYPSLEEGGPEGQTKVGKISRKELEELAKFIINKNFFSLEDNYICDPLECGTDRQYTSITVTIGCQTKSITLYTEAERPKEIGEIINKILSYNGQLSCTLSAPKYR